MIVDPTCRLLECNMGIQTPVDSVATRSRGRDGSSKTNATIAGKDGDYDRLFLKLIGHRCAGRRVDGNVGNSHRQSI